MPKEPERIRATNTSDFANVLVLARREIVNSPQRQLLSSLPNAACSTGRPSLAAAIVTDVEVTTIAPTSRGTAPRRSTDVTRPRWAALHHRGHMPFRALGHVLLRYYQCPFVIPPIFAVRRHDFVRAGVVPVVLDHRALIPCSSSSSSSRHRHRRQPDFRNALHVRRARQMCYEALKADQSVARRLRFQMNSSPYGTPHPTSHLA